MGKNGTKNDVDPMTGAVVPAPGGGYSSDRKAMKEHHERSIAYMDKVIKKKKEIGKAKRGNK